MVLSKDLKIAICFGLIIGAIISFCSMCYAAEETEIDITNVSGIGINPGTGTITNSGGSVSYFLAEKDKVYIISNNNPSTTTSPVYVATSEVIPANEVSIDIVATLNGQETYQYIPSETGYVYVSFGNFRLQNVVVTAHDIGLFTFVNDLAYALSIGNLSQVWVYVVPFLTISVLFGLGFYLGCKIFDKIKRAKGGV